MSEQDKKALTESFIIDGEIGEDENKQRVIRKKKLKKVKKTKKGPVDLEELHKANYRLSQSLADIEDESDLINSSSVSTREIYEATDDSSDYSEGSADSSSGSILNEHHGLGKFFLHLSLLLHKTLIMFMRNKTVVLIQMFCPILWCVCLIYFNSREPVLREMRPIYGERYDLSPLGKCYGENCVTIGYSIIGDPKKQEEYSWIDDIMKSVANSNNMEYREDVKKMTVGTTQNFFHYLKLNPNSTLYSVVWCVDQWTVELNGKEIALPCSYDAQAKEGGQELILYTIWYNNSL